MDKRESAKHFLKMVAFGEVRPAYEKYIAKNFIHHNQYFKSDRESLMIAMEQAHQTHPNKVFDIKKCYVDQDTVVTHSHLQLKADAPQMSAVHIMRFEGEKIVEMWDVVQMLEKNSPNEKGAF